MQRQGGLLGWCDCLPYHALFQWVKLEGIPDRAHRGTADSEFPRETLCPRAL